MRGQKATGFRSVLRSSRYYGVEPLERRRLLSANMYLASPTFKYSARNYELDEGQATANGWSAAPNGIIDTNNPNAINRAKNGIVRVELDASPSVSQSGITLHTVEAFSWTIVGAAGTQTVSIDPANGLTGVAYLRAGAYSMTMDIHLAAENDLQSGTQRASFSNIVIVSIGDSYSSGEGNPEVPAYMAAGGNAIWADDGIGYWGITPEKNTHRSSHSFPSLTAMKIEADDPTTAVTFVSLAESGAVLEGGDDGKTIDGGILTGGTDRMDQVDELIKILGNTPIDEVMMTGGGNDIGFSSLIKGLIKNTNDPQDVFDTVPSDVNSTFWHDKVVESYQLLGNELARDVDQRKLDIDNIFVAEYPDPLRGLGGSKPSMQAEDIVGGYIHAPLDFSFGTGITAAEAGYLETYAMRPLNAAVAKGVSIADSSGPIRWHYVTGIADAFAREGAWGHGYPAPGGREQTIVANPNIPGRITWGLHGSTDDKATARWIRTADESRGIQEDSLGSLGIYHPNQTGHYEMSKIVLAEIRPYLPKHATADLALSYFDAETTDGSTPQPGSEMNFGFTVTNDGASNTQAGNILFQMNGVDTSTSMAETETATIGEFDYPALAAGETYTSYFIVRLPDEHATFWSGAQVYSTYALLETNDWETTTNNNSSTGPDLYVDAPTNPKDVHFEGIQLISGTLAPGHTVTVQVTAASPIQRHGVPYYLFLSADQTYDSSDIGAQISGSSIFAPDWEINRLPANGLDVHQFTFTLPPASNAFWAGRSYAYLLPVFDTYDFPFAPIKAQQEGTDFLRVINTPDPDDTIGQLQPVSRNWLAAGGTASFTLDSPIDADLIHIQATAGQQYSFDYDRTTGNADALLRLFDANGRELASNDNAAAPGESAGSDPYLTYTFDTSGTYYLGVSAGANDGYNPVDGSSLFDGGYGAAGTYPSAYKLSVATIPTTTPGKGTVSGVAFIDTDGDDTRDTGEAVLGGVQVYLDYNGDGRPSTGEPVATTATDGSYKFTNVPQASTRSSTGETITCRRSHRARAPLA